MPLELAEARTLFLGRCSATGGTVLGRTDSATAVVCCGSEADCGVCCGSGVEFGVEDEDFGGLGHGSPPVVMATGVATMVNGMLAMTNGMEAMANVMVAALNGVVAETVSADRWSRQRRLAEVHQGAAVLSSSSALSVAVAQWVAALQARWAAVAMKVLKQGLFINLPGDPVSPLHIPTTIFEAIFEVTTTNHGRRTSHLSRAHGDRRQLTPTNGRQVAHMELSRRPVVESSVLARLNVRSAVEEDAWQPQSGRPSGMAVRSVVECVGWERVMCE
ncbi:hypothetical protein LR48_Vigan11g080700 [Vigna angularis]|uniref:Uncharacterized protein n=1 Tax=Phaseolus angularis TaxID=3914 RepID=A0A0L9VSN2_PHAAN|nr:hypothetical protein LR48_Vigan11g080700 [Vigna angularis]